jgi:LysM repeat protein
MRGLKGIFLSLFTLACLFFIFSAAHASVEYRVKKGDSLARIARKYHVSLKELKRENRAYARQLKPGVKIIIPGSKVAQKKVKEERHKREATLADESSEADGDVTKPERSTIRAGLAKEEQNETAVPVPHAENLYHTVKKGDTLASISKKYSTPVAEIKELNNLKSLRLKKGRKLLVKRIGPKTYIVKKGDSIRKVAKKFDMEADDLMEMNELGSPSLPVGQKLYLEQKVDAETAAAYHEAVGKNVEEEIRKTSENEEFAEKPMKEKLIVFAKKLLNIPYKFGGNSILGIDCSAYVKKVYGLLGIELPRTAREQFQAGGETVDRDDLSIGDLVFFRTYASFPSHVGIYIGNNLFIHASSKGKKVTIDSLETPYYLKRFIGGKRLLTQETAETDPNS